jgi:transposase
MHRLQEVVRLHRMGNSARVISRRLRMSRNTIQSYLGALERGGLLAGEPAELPELAKLRACIDAQAPAKAAPQQASSIERWLSRIAELYVRAGPTAIHDFLRLNEPDYTGSLSAVKRVCRRLDRARGPLPEDVAIPVETAPGEVAQVDFKYAGKRFDPVQGVLRKSWIFLMTLGFSRRSFAQLAFDQKVETWLSLHVEAFEYFGGVPHVLVPDNLKAAVVRCAFGVDGDPVLNRSYVELARHYSFQVDPTPPSDPKKKGKVESGCRYVGTSFLSAWTSVDMPTDRGSLRRWLDEVANVRVHQTTRRRPSELFEEVERAALLALPGTRWDPVVWRKARVHSDGHVQIDGAFYSVPWTRLHKEVWARCSRSSVSIWDGEEHLHTHVRVAAGKRSIVESHLPEHRGDLRHRSREHWVERARLMGEEVERLVEAIFGSDDVLLRLRKVQAVVKLLEAHPAARARATAERALHFGCREYAGIKNILRQGLDLQPLPQQRTCAWASGSRHARRPVPKPTLFQEPRHVGHR